MKNITTETETTRLIESGHSKNLAEARMLAESHGLSGYQKVTSFRECISTLNSAYNSLLITAYEKLLSTHSTERESVLQKINELKDQIQKKKRKVALRKVTLSKEKNLSLVLLRFFFWLILALFIMMADWIVASEVLELFISTRFGAMLLASGIAVALFLLPILTVLYTQKLPPPHRKWFEIIMASGATLIFILMVIARRHYDEQQGNESGWFSSLLFLSLNLLFYFTLHRLANLLLLPVIQDIRPAGLTYLEKRKVKAKENEIYLLKTDLNYYEQQEKLFCQTERIAAVNEEKINRMYLEAIEVYRESAKLCSEEIPPYLYSDPPKLNFLVLNSISIEDSLHSNTSRRRIGFMPILILLFFMASCSGFQKEPSTFVGVLLDMSDNIPSSQNISCNTLKPFFGLEAHPLRGINLVVLCINDRKITTGGRATLSAQSSLLSNTFQRKKDMEIFFKTTDSLLSAVKQHVEIPSRHSLVFYRVSHILSEFQASSEQKGIVILTTDLFENSPVFRFYEEQNNASDQPEIIVERLVNAYPPPVITKPLTIIIHHLPSAQDEESFLLMAEILRNYVHRASTKITIQIMPAL